MGEDGCTCEEQLSPEPKEPPPRGLTDTTDIAPDPSECPDSVYTEFQPATNPSIMGMDTGWRSVIQDEHYCVL